jgi:hypothetical protein
MILPKNRLNEKIRNPYSCFQTNSAFMKNSLSMFNFNSKQHQLWTSFCSKVKVWSEIFIQASMPESLMSNNLSSIGLDIFDDNFWFISICLWFWKWIFFKSCRILLNENYLTDLKFKKLIRRFTSGLFLEHRIFIRAKIHHPIRHNSFLMEKKYWKFQNWQLANHLKSEIIDFKWPFWPISLNLVSEPTILACILCRNRYRKIHINWKEFHRVSGEWTWMN